MEIATPGFCTFHNFNLAEMFAAIPTFIYYFLLMVYVFITILIDIITFTFEKGCSPIEYFFKDDTLGFRAQFYFSLFAITVSWIGTFYNLWGPFVAYSNADTWDKYTTIFLFVTGEIGYLIGYGGGCFGLFVIFIQKILSCIRTTKYDSEFEALINDKKGKEIFKKYAKAEWSLENILFYEDVQNYLKSPTVKYASRRGREILKNYIEYGAPLEVNFSADVRKHLMNKLKNFDQHSDQYLFIFDKSLEEVKRNMRDTYNRIPTSEFKSWISLKIKKDVDLSSIN